MVVTVPSFAIAIQLLDVMASKNKILLVATLQSLKNDMTIYHAHRITRLVETVLRLTARQD